jgi:hypothetical protein
MEARRLQIFTNGDATMIKLPDFLEKYPYFCVWKFCKERKVPYNPRTRKRARPNLREDFAPMDCAAKEVINGRFNGLAIGVFEDLIGIDIDDCISQDGEISALAREIISIMDSYTEYSPSGTGFRIFARGKINFNRDKFYIMNRKNDLEVYIAGATKKFLTVTGKQFEGSKFEINFRSEETQKVLEKFMLRPDKDEYKTRVYISQLKKNDKFTKLFEGDMQGYNSQSEADLAFCNIAAKVTKQAEIIDKIYRESKLYREKWERQDYRTATISKAIENAQIRAPKTQKFNPTEVDTLIQKEIPALNWIVPEIISQGVTLLASPPKCGKSWFVLDLCVNVSRGEFFLGKRCPKRACLYLALEDSERRLKERVLRILNGRQNSPNFYYETNISDIEHGFLESLAIARQKYPQIELIVVDTLQKVRGLSKRGEGAYGTDYREIGAIKSFADKNNISIILVHHLSKAKKDDPFDRISGTQGMFGAVDEALVISKENRQSDSAILSITGRDAECQEYEILFDKNLGKWNLIGTTEERERRAYDENPIVKAIKYLLEPYDYYTGTTNQIKEIACREYGESDFRPLKSIEIELRELAPLFLKFDDIKYQFGGYKNRFALQSFRKNTKNEE